MVKKPVFREKPAGSGDDHKKMQILRENFYAAGKCPALAGLLPGVQGEIPAGRVPHQKVSEMRKDLHLPIKRPELAKILPGMSEKAYLM